VRRVGNRRLLEFVVETLALGDLKSVAKALVIGAKTKQSADQRLVSAVAFTRSRKGAVELKEPGLRRSADEAAREETEPARSGSVRGGRSDHDRANDIKQTYHVSRASNIKEDYQLGAAGGPAGGCERLQ